MGNLNEQKVVTFEEDYLYRTNRTIISNPDYALTEAIANCWDAGATEVNIGLPENEGGIISIEDNGTGMTEEEFMKRWMVLSYNRQRHQGLNVVFPDNNEHGVRRAYGKNGVGRHGLLCFNDNYYISTWKNGTKNTYHITVSSGNAPFKIFEHNSEQSEGHGTKIWTYSCTNTPNVAEMKEIISSRFLYDPNFKIIINGELIELTQHKGVIKTIERTINNKFLKIYVVDSTKTALKSQQHGIAFWVQGRLVGKPSWVYGDTQFLDGRSKPAKRFTIIVQADDLEDLISPDWGSFLEIQNTKIFFSFFIPFMKEVISDILSEHIRETQEAIIQQERHVLFDLAPYEKRDVSVFIESVTRKNPMISQEFMSLAIDALVNIQKSQNGALLLGKLAKLDSSDLDELTNLLNNWDIKDILTVLREIDNRIIVIEAIDRLREDPSVDKLHQLHPLILESRWLFGAEFDSPMYTANKALTTVIKNLFKESDYDVNALSFASKRPDVVCLAESTIGAVCSERTEKDCREILKPDNILIIELKKGGFEIGYKEKSQAEQYVRQIKKSGILHKESHIHAFVVGAKIGDIDATSSNESGDINVVTFGQLVQTSKLKLFKLREKLQKRYDSMDDKSIVEKALSVGQMSMKLSK